MNKFFANSLTITSHLMSLTKRTTLTSSMQLRYDIASNADIRRKKEMRNAQEPEFSTIVNDQAVIIGSDDGWLNSVLARGYAVLDNMATLADSDWEGTFLVRDELDGGDAELIIVTKRKSTIQDVARIEVDRDTNRIEVVDTRTGKILGSTTDVVAMFNFFPVWPTRNAHLNPTPIPPLWPTKYLSHIITDTTKLKAHKNVVYVVHYGLAVFHHAKDAADALLQWNQYRSALFFEKDTMGVVDVDPRTRVLTVYVIEKSKASNVADPESQVMLGSGKIAPVLVVFFDGLIRYKEKPPSHTFIPRIAIRRRGAAPPTTPS